jgi:ankyrin repeat domain-containing protein 50
VRPLTLKEMNMALEIEDGSRSYEDLDLEKEASFETTVKNLCGLFVSVIDRKIYLIHQTAKEFLVARKGTASLGIWKYSLETTESELILTKICMSYLLFTIFDSDPLLIRVGASEDDVEKNINQYINDHNFLDYAAKHWAIHYQRAQARMDTAMQELNFSICDVRSQRFLTWFQVYWISVASFSRCPQNFTSLMTASYLGHETVVGLLLEKDVDLEASDESHGQTPLSLAAENGHEAVVKLLLEKGAELETKSSNGRTPLSWAAENGHEAVVSKILRLR